MSNTLPTKVSKRLREQTREAHQSTDAVLSVAAPVGTLAGYERFLLVMLDAYTEFGAAIDHASAAAKLPARSRLVSGHLRTDLATVTGDRVADHRVEVALGTSPSISSLTIAFGSAYALEGASLGASILRRRVHPGHQGATSYFDAVIDDRTTRWPAFVESLDKLPDDLQTTSALRTGALAVFDHVRSTAQKGLMLS